MEMIEIAEIVRAAHESINIKLTTGQQLAIVQKIIDAKLSLN